VRIAAGCTFPWHTHRGEELNLLLAGSLRDHEGRRFQPGAEIVLAAGSAHDITAEPGEDVILAARVFEGIELASQP
jgi:anti-sigma factor ChrR (cupin superfamily)